MENLYSPETRSGGLLSLFWRHKGKVLLMLFLGMGLTLAYIGLAPRKFASNAKLFVQIGRESVTLDPTATTGQLVGVADSRESEVLAVEELLGSRLLAENTVDHFGPEKILEKDPKRPGLQLSKRLSFLDPYNLNPLRVYSLRDKAIESLLENLRVGAVNKTSVLSARYVAEDPQLARDVLSYLLAQACDEHVRVHRTKGSQEFFAGQTELLKTKLAGLEEQYRDLKNRTGLAALESQREIELQQLGSLQADLKRAHADRDGIEAELRERHEKLEHQPQFIVSERTTGQPQSTGQSLREKVFDLEVHEQELASKYTDENPLLIQLRSQLAEARRIAAREKPGSEVKSSVSETYKATQLAVQEREAELVAINARSAALDTQIAVIEANLKQINDSEVELKRLEREIELTRTNYIKYAENLEQARINQELEEAKITSLTLMQPPSYSETPVSPQPLVAIAMGLALSLICGAGVAVLADGRRRPAVTAAGVASTPAPTTIVIEHAAPATSETATSTRRSGEFAPAHPR